MALTDLNRTVATATTVLVTRFHSYVRQHSSRLPLNRFDSRLARLADSR